MNKRAFIILAILCGGSVAWLNRPPQPHPETDTPEQRAENYYYSDIHLPYFVRSGDLYKPQRPGNAATPFSVVKAPDAFRVFIVGGSIAMRFGPGAVSNLQAALEAALGKRPIEVVNCGMGGYDSFRESMLIDELLGYAPDAIVLLSGKNEGLGSPPVPLWSLRLLRLARMLGLRSADGGRLKSREREARGTDIQASLNARFRTNLASMLEKTRARGVRLVVVLPPVNFEEWPVRAASPYEAPLAPGWVRSLARDDAGALEALSKALPTLSPDQAATASYLMARSHARLGHWDAAGRAYTAAFSDPADARCGPRRLEVMREAALAGGGVVADADAELRALLAPRPPGYDVFIDGVHWILSYNDQVTSSVLKALRADPLLAGLAWNDAGLGRAQAAIARAAGRPAPEVLREESERSLRQALSLAQPGNSRGFCPDWHAVVPFTALMRRFPEWFADLEATAGRAESGPGKARSPLGMQGLQVDPAGFAWHAAEAWLLVGRSERALPLLRRALKEQDIKGAWVGRAEAAALSGDAEAADSLRKAREAAAAVHDESLAPLFEEIERLPRRRR